MSVSGEISWRLTIGIVLRAVVLGVLTTVAVAWALAAWLPHRNLQKQFDSIWPERKEAWAMVWVREYRRAGMSRRLWWVSPFPHDQKPVVSSLDTRLGGRDRSGRWEWRDWGGLERIVRECDPAVTDFGFDDSRGWPFRALWCEVSHAPANVTTRLWDARGGVIIMNKSVADVAALRVLPLRPIWKGLAADGAIYAGAWFGGMLGVAWILGARRRRNGCCVRCGYDLRGTARDGCPECGRHRAPGRAAPIVDEHSISRPNP